jgi:hypothetical protein
MSITSAPRLLSALVAAGILVVSGCHASFGPTGGMLSYPIPVSPYYQDKLEDEYWEKERYDRVPILGPITGGGPPVALDPPSPDEVMRALPTSEGGIPLLHEVHRDNVRIVVEPIADYVDPPRVYPLIGPAPQHHCHYKCTVFYKENEDAQEVVYIDHNHLHMVGNVDPYNGGF